MINLTMTQLEEADECSSGFCVSCEYEQSGVEPDATKYTCENCGKQQVYGAAELVLMGLVRIVGDEDEDN